MVKDPDKTDSAWQAAKQHTQQYGQSLWSIFSRYGRPKTSQKTAPTQNIDPFQYEHSSFLRLLAAVPYSLGLLFVVSFFWDFNGLSYLIFGNTFQFEGLLRILSVSGLIGFFTNWVAITMLFKPAQKRPLLGHGLIPAQKDRIAFRLAQAVATDLINPEIIKQKIHESDLVSRYRKKSTRYIKTIIDDPAFRTDLKQWVVGYVDEMIANPDIRAAIAQKILLQIEKSVEETPLERAALKAYTFVKGQKMQQIVEEALDRLPHSIENGLDRFDILLDELPHKIEAHSDTIEEFLTTLLYKLINQLDVHTLVEDKLQQYDEQRISDIILKATNEQLNYIQYLGGILGVIGGLLIWEPLFSVIMLGILIVLVFSIDALLMRFHEKRRGL